MLSERGYLTASLPPDATSRPQNRARRRPNLPAAVCPPPRGQGASAAKSRYLGDPLRRAQALLTLQMVCLMIGNLKRDGAIKSRPHRIRGRVLQCTLTPRELSLLQKCGRHAMALERKLAVGKKAEELRTIRRSLCKIAENLQH